MNPRQAHWICENCHYSSDTTMSMSGESIADTKDEDGHPLEVLQCRRHTPDRWELITATAWCGEGRFESSDRPDATSQRF